MKDCEDRQLNFR